MKRFNFFLDNEQREELDLMSGESGYSVSDHIRRAIDNYLDGRRVSFHVEDEDMGVFNVVPSEVIIKLVKDWHRQHMAS